MKRLLCMLIFIASQDGAALDVSPHSPSQEAKATRRWSLSQWMEQKGKIQWMDLWLQTPDSQGKGRSGPWIYDVYLGGDYSSYNRNTSSALISEGHYNSSSYHAGAFVSVFGLHGKYETSTSEQRTNWDGLLQLRLMGASDQGSHINLFYGLRSQEVLNDKVNLQQAGGSLTFYLVNFWAVEGKYQHFFEGTSNAGNKISGYRFEATSWIEWGGVRVYGTWFHEPEDYTMPSGAVTLKRDGVSAGVRVYLDFKK